MVKYSLNNFKPAMDDILLIREIDLSLGDPMRMEDIYLLIICLADKRNDIYGLLVELGYAVFAGDECIEEINAILRRKSIKYLILTYSITFKHLIEDGELLPHNLDIDLVNRYVIEH